MPSGNIKTIITIFATPDDLRRAADQMQEEWDGYKKHGKFTNPIIWDITQAEIHFKIASDRMKSNLIAKSL